MSVETETNTTETVEASSTETPTPSPTETPSAEPKEGEAPEKIDLGEEGDKPKEGETEGDKPKEGEADERYGAPEGDAAYEIKLEGDDQIDADALAMVTPALKELNLSNAAANKLVGVFAGEVLPHYEKQFEKALEGQIAVQRTEWEGAARDLIAGKSEAGEPLVAKNAAGDELSFDGKDMKGVQAAAAKVMDKYAPEGFRKFLNETGLGVHPQLISFIYQVAKATAEDGDFEGGSIPKKELSRTEKYYPPKG